MYSGCQFIYDNIPSEIYDMTIMSINNNGYEYESGSGTEFSSDSVWRNPEVLFLGAKQSPVLSFDIEFVCGHDMDVFETHAVKDWLFGPLKFSHLQICLENMETFYFNCRLIPNKTYIFAGRTRGFGCTVECDSPWAWEFPATRTWNYSTTANNTIHFNNVSGDSEGLRPIVSFTLTLNNSNFTIINRSDNNREFKWTGLQGGETITVDNATEIITSSTGLRRIKNFNKKYLRLIKGINELYCIGTVKELKITYQNARRLGGG